MVNLSVGVVNKYLPDWVWKLSQKQSIKLVESDFGDGCYKKFSVIYYTSSKRLADDFMRLCLHADTCNKSLHHEKEMNQL